MRQMNILQVADDAERAKAEKIGYTAATSEDQAKQIAETGGCEFLRETSDGWVAFESATDADTWDNQQ